MSVVEAHDATTFEYLGSEPADIDDVNTLAARETIAATALKIVAQRVEEGYAVPDGALIVAGERDQHQGGFFSGVQVFRYRAPERVVGGLERLR